MHPYLHGLAPSATINIRKELRLTSLWSLWAKSDQCISRDFTTATRAENKQIIMVRVQNKIKTNYKII